MQVEKTFLFLFFVIFWGNYRNNKIIKNKYIYIFV